MQHSWMVVTGAASGIGLATVELLLEQGAYVLALDNNAEKLGALTEQFKHYGDHLADELLDITDEARIAPVLETYHLQRPIGGLVNSAGFGRDVTFLNTDSALLRATFEVNVLAAFSISREAALLMREHRQGAIVHISSVSGLVGNRGRAAYGITKAGLINLTQVMANELAQEGIRVNCVCPGPIMTPLAMQVHTEQVQETWKSAVPMHRYGTPREVAQAICFLLDSEKTAYMTGQIISVDGGFVTTGLLA
ncbi:SDR family NAD(P)-dependent oxidoreductase [Alcaligenes faecalis]|uniref:SDR family NAD(P)-dependent oxidoreductase n=1 Tax=Alcaligenes faecalis TaxID=511 RepID=UPI0024BCA3D9|nr:SDR family oxidoreductase [Alcaligenes faecalis]WHQ44823.1 SDR family oxidoreductase [Alcaligenes faecalis]